MGYVQVRLNTGTVQRDEFLPTQCLASFASFSKAIQEKLPSTLTWAGEERQPVPRIELYGFSVGEHDWTRVEQLQHKDIYSADDYVDVTWPDTLPTNTLKQTQAVLGNTTFAPAHIPAGTASNTNEFSRQIHVNGRLGTLKGQALSACPSVPRQQPANQLLFTEVPCSSAADRLDSFADAVFAAHGMAHFIGSISDTLQRWAASLFSSNEYVTATQEDSSLNMYLFPFQTESDIQLLGFFLTRAAFRQACLLRKRFLLVLDLDETLGTSNEDFGLQFLRRRCDQLDEETASEVRKQFQTLCHSDDRRPESLLYAANKVAEQHQHAWAQKESKVQYINQQLAAMQATGKHQQWVSGALQDAKLCNAALLGQLPDKEDFSTAYLLNNLHLKLCRVRVLLADHIQTPQQLQERMSQDEPLQQLVPHAKLRVLECKLVTLQDGIRRHQLRVELAGQLHRTGPELQEVVVYTHYGQHVSDTITGHVELKCVDVLFVVRPHVQHMLDSLCCRQDDQHKCEVAVCTAADEAYAKAFCAALDPEKQHLLAPEARFVARAKRKKLSSVTDIPQAAVILDDCPQQAQGSTVWSVDSLHRALPIIPYIPAVDDQAMRVTLCHLHVVHKKYTDAWTVFRTKITWLADQPFLLENFSTLRSLLPDTQAPVQFATHRSYANAAVARSSSAGATVGSTQDIAEVNSQARQLVPVTHGPRLPAVPDSPALHQTTAALQPQQSAAHSSPSGPQTPGQGRIDRLAASGNSWSTPEISMLPVIVCNAATPPGPVDSRREAAHSTAQFASIGSVCAHGNMGVQQQTAQAASLQGRELQHQASRDEQGLSSRASASQYSVASGQNLDSRLSLSSANPQAAADQQACESMCNRPHDGFDSHSNSLSTWQRQDVHQSNIRNSAYPCCRRDSDAERSKTRYRDRSHSSSRSRSPANTWETSRHETHGRRSNAWDDLHSSASKEQQSPDRDDHPSSAVLRQGRHMR